MGPEIAKFRAIIGLLRPTIFLAKMSNLNTVYCKNINNYFHAKESLVLHMGLMVVFL